MTYIVLDLEWNQAMSAKSSVFNHLPIHLRGEIIQIGAVKLNADFTPGEEFQRDVSPVWFKKMHFKVKKLTGFDNARLAHGLPFPEAMRQFLEWCGPDCVFMTWGYDDSGIMEQNCIIHDLDIDWMGKWINLQVIYSVQTDGDRNQKSLEGAMEYFGIEQTRVAHDALGDAYNTALVCSHLDLASGVEAYPSILEKYAHHSAAQNGPVPVEHSASHAYSSREELWAMIDQTPALCPECEKQLELSRWVNQGDRRYMALGTCDEHGPYLYRIRVRHGDDDSWQATRLVYKADEAMVENFRARQAKPRRRHRTRSNKQSQ